MAGTSGSTPWWRRLLPRGENHKEPTPLTDLTNLAIDITAPATFTAYPPVPTYAEQLTHINSQIAQLAAAGAIDHGTPRILSGRIAAHQQIRDRIVQLEHTDRCWLIDQRASDLKEQVEARGQSITELQQQIQTIDAELRQMRLRPQPRRGRNGPPAGETP